VSLLQVFLLVEIVLLICLGISYTMYVYTRHLVSENYPVGYDTLKYTRILKRNRFWEFNTLSIICLQILLLALISTGYGISVLGTFILTVR
jgi:hypothetical protein